MNKKNIKFLFVSLIVFALTTNAFAAVVSDNDASALVTKKEFEAYKDNFNKKIETYVNGITGYIDGAIVVYLADFAGARIEDGNLIDY